MFDKRLTLEKVQMLIGKTQEQMVATLMKFEGSNQSLDRFHRN